MLENLFKKIDEKYPSMLAVLGVSGFYISLYSAIKATPRAVEELNKTDIQETGLEKLKIQSRILLPIYAPTIGMALISTSAIMHSVYVSNNRNGALSLLYYSSIKYMEDWQEKVLNDVGKTRFKKIENEVISPTSTEIEKIVFKNDDELVVWDYFSKRAFSVKTLEDLRRMVNDLNDILIKDEFASINDFYEMIGLDYIPYGEHIGWVLENGTIKATYGAKLSKDNKPIATIKFDLAPRHVNSIIEDYDD